MSDTIYALATPPGRSGVAVIRVSGPLAPFAAEALAGAGIEERRATLRRLRDPRDGRILDDGLVLLFAGPASFTGENIVEFQVHGGPAVCQALGAALQSLPGLREAEAGEFTRRALLNGKIDLTQAEGLGDLLAAETQAQAQQAIALMDGALSRRVQDWRDLAVGALARVEAVIDFDDQDLPGSVLDQALSACRELEAQLGAELAGSAASERIRIGFDVALVGAPNAGKSTLLNAIAGRDAALTSEIAGTTRDAIEVRLDLRGLPVTLVDLAGIREASDLIEKLGVERALQRAEAADLRVVLVDGNHGPNIEHRPGDIVLAAKDDLGAEGGVSGLTGAGVPELLTRIERALAGRATTSSLAARDRQRDAVARALAGVSAARVRLKEMDVDLAAAELMHAVRALDMLIGRVDVESVLDEVFRQFCIGK